MTIYNNTLCCHSIQLLGGVHETTVSTDEGNDVNSFFEEVEIKVVFVNSPRGFIGSDDLACFGIAYVDHLGTVIQDRNGGGKFQFDLTKPVHVRRTSGLVVREQCRGIHTVVVDIQSVRRGTRRSYKLFHVIIDTCWL